MTQNTKCYELCDCTCGTAPTDVDTILQAETRFIVTLHDLCHSNVMWFTEDHHLLERSLTGREGVYILWHKDDYCATHERFHMKALYVGKGRFAPRIYSHWKGKDFSNELLVYWTFVEFPNRQAKYVEQLLLDLFAFPLNKAEAKGTTRLCAHLTQAEVD